MPNTAQRTRSQTCTRRRRATTTLSLLITLPLLCEPQRYELDGEVARRHEGVEQIERDVVQVNEMFNDLSLLVSSQQQYVDTIESNISRTKDSTRDAHEELQRASQYQKRSRSKMCKLLMALGTGFAILVLGVAVL